MDVTGTVRNTVGSPLAGVNVTVLRREFITVNSESAALDELILEGICAGDLPTFECNWRACATTTGADGSYVCPVNPGSAYTVQAESGSESTGQQTAEASLGSPMPEPEPEPAPAPFQDAVPEPPPPVTQAVSAAVSETLASTGAGANIDDAQLRGLIQQTAERVVWEVVPEIAEALIQKEIKRLTE